MLRKIAGWRSLGVKGNLLKTTGTERADPGVGQWLPLHYREPAPGSERPDAPSKRPVTISLG